MFQGRLFDGRQSRGVEVAVVPVEGGLRLEDTEGGAPVFWAWSDLPRSSLTATRDTMMVTRGRQTLEVRDPGIVPVLRAGLPRASLFRSPFQTWIATPGRYALTLAIALGALAGAFFVLVPWGGDAIAASLPPDLERASGLALKNRLIEGFGVTSRVTTAMQEFWEALDLPTQPTEVTVVDDGTTANAFALMGGQIVVYQALVDLAQSPDELAGVLAHEAAHGELHHSARLIGRSLAGAFLLSYLLGDPTGITGAILGNVDTLRQLQFSREMEAEADAWAVKALQGKTDTKALGRLLTRLDRHPLPAWASFLGNHPGTPDRVRVLGATGIEAKASDRLQQLFQELKATGHSKH